MEFEITRAHYICFSDCGSNPADIVFLLDSSGSVGTTNFQKQKDFVAHFAQSFDIGPQKVQIGVVTFSSATHNIFNMNKYHDKTSLTNAIHSIPYNSGGTRTDLALKHVATNSFTSAAGDRPGVANILIVMTDGQSNQPTLTRQEANKLHQKNIKVFAIGIGSGASRTELDVIASDSHHVFQVTNFNALSTLQAELKKTACKGTSYQYALFSEYHLPANILLKSISDYYRSERNPVGPITHHENMPI